MTKNITDTKFLSLLFISTIVGIVGIFVSFWFIYLLYTDTNFEHINILIIMCIFFVSVTIWGKILRSYRIKFEKQNQITHPFNLLDTSSYYLSNTVVWLIVFILIKIGYSYIIINSLKITNELSFLIAALIIGFLSLDSVYGNTTITEHAKFTKYRLVDSAAGFLSLGIILSFNIDSINFIHFQQIITPLLFLPAIINLAQVLGDITSYLKGRTQLREYTKIMLPNLLNNIKK